MTPFTMLMCHVVETSPQWGYALLLMNPVAGSEMRLGADSVTVHFEDDPSKRQTNTASALMPVTHAVLGHAQDRLDLAAQGWDADALSQFDAVAGVLAAKVTKRLTQSLPHATPSLHQGADMMLSAFVEKATTLRDLVGVAKVVAAPFALSHALPRSADAPKLNIIFTGAELPDDLDVQPGALPQAALPGAPEVVRNIITTFAAGDVTPEAVNVVVEHSCDLLIQDNAGHAAEWATLLTEMAFSQVRENEAMAEIIAGNALVRYNKLRRMNSLL